MSTIAQHYAVVVIPFNQLRKGTKNPRKMANTDAAQMAKSLEASGQIQNLVVCDSGDSTYEVMAGNSRYDGFALLVESGKISDEHPVNCVIADAGDYESLATIENMVRKQMHPADEFDAVLKMSKAGMTIDRIADMLGVTPLVVERRMRVASAAPEILALYRNDEITTDQVIALCATDDHQLQVSTWENAYGNNRTPARLRQQVTAAEVDVSKDLRVRFIGGADAFKAAGGVVRTDMFSELEGTGFISDVALLDRLVLDKLNLHAAALQAEGWMWVAVSVSRDHELLDRCGKVTPEAVPLSEADEATIAAFKKERDELTTEHIEIDKRPGDAYTDEEEARIEFIDDRCEALSEGIAAIEAASTAFPGETKAYAGAAVFLESGNIMVQRGLVRQEDRKELTKANRSVSGGRETAPAGRKDSAISDALRRSLLGYRNTAAQLAVAQNVRVAKVLLACKIAATAWSDGGMVPSDFSNRESSSGTRMNHPMEGADGEAMKKRLAAVGTSIFGTKKLKDQDLWSFMSALSDAELDQVIAFGVGNSVSLWTEHKGITGCLLDGMAFDVSDYFTPNVDNYFGRVPKDFCVSALIESGKRSPRDKEVLLAMKKTDLAKVASDEIAGTDWVPVTIRAPKAKAAKKPVEPAKATGKVTAKAPAKAPAKGKAKAKAKAPVKAPKKAKGQPEAAAA